MRRSLTYLTVLFLLLAGGVFTQEWVTRGEVLALRPPSPLPEVPSFNILGYEVPGGLLMALIAGFVVFNVLGMGITMAIVVSRLGGEVARGAKRADSVPPPAAKKEEVVPPGQPLSERAALSMVLVFVLLGALWAATREMISPLPAVPAEFRLPGGVAIPGWVILGGIVSLLVGGTVVTGFALARAFGLFSQTLVAATTQPPRPLDFTRPLRLIVGLTKTRMTFVQMVFTCLDVVLIFAIVGVLLAFVVPSYLRVTQAEQAARAAVVPTPAPTEPVAEATAADPSAEFAALPPGAAAAGEATFKAQPCAACHSLEPDVTLVGPSLAGIGSRAEARVPGLASQAYLYQSIVNPNTFVVEGFAAGVMPGNFKESLAPQQIADLVAYLDSLK